MDGAALKHKRAGVHAVNPQGLTDLGSHRIVPLPLRIKAVIGSAPGIELPVNPRQPALAVRHKGGPCVPGPGVVRLNGQKDNPCVLRPPESRSLRAQGGFPVRGRLHAQSICPVRRGSRPSPKCPARLLPFRSGHQHVHPLALPDGLRHPDKGLLGLHRPIVPGSRPPGPDHDAALVGLKLTGHAPPARRRQISSTIFL